jgi:transcriptional regulator with XRE-family HTH domain
MERQRETLLTVGERLHVARLRAGVKTQDMAERIGRHRNRVTAYEQSAAEDQPLWVLRAWAESLDNDTTVEWLAAEVGPAPRITAAPRSRRRANQDRSGSPVTVGFDVEHVETVEYASERGGYHDDRDDGGDEIIDAEPVDWNTEPEVDVELVGYQLPHGHAVTAVTARGACAHITRGGEPR